MENIAPKESVATTNLGSSNLTDYGERIVQADVFEEVIEDIDKDIRKFDLAASILQNTEHVSVRKISQNHLPFRILLRGIHKHVHSLTPPYHVLL